MKFKKLIFVSLFFLGTVLAFAANSNAETFVSYLKESCRGEKGWHAEYSLSLEERKGDSLTKISTTADLLLLCPHSIRFSFSEKDNSFEFISDSVQAWIIHQKKGENFKRVEQYNSVSKRGINSWLGLFSKALDLSSGSFADFNSLLSVEKVNVEGEKIKRFEIQNRKNLDKLTVDFGNDLEPRFNEIIFQQKKYSFKLKFQKQIKDKKSADLKSYNFYAQPGDKITLLIDKPE